MGEGVRDGATAAVGPAAGVIEPEVIFETLSNHRRRYTLHYLKQRNERVTVRELSEQVAAWENGTSLADVTPKERKRVYTALHQTHLPKMDQVGVVDYDRNRGTVALTRGIESFDIYLDVVPEQELDWGEFYLGLGVLGTALALALTVDVYPLTLLPDVVYVAVISLTMLLAGGIHVLSRRRTRLGSQGPPADVIEPPPDIENS